MEEGDGNGLVGMSFNRLRGFDQGGDILPLRRDDDHNHQRTANQRHFVDILILHTRNVRQFIADANALLGACK